MEPETRQRVLALIVLAVGLLVLSQNAFFSYSFSNGPNWINVSVDTTVNVTNSPPEILSVVIVDPITLNAGTTQAITCNATIRDYNGGNTITNVSATFYDNNTAGPGDADDNNTHYTNASCTSTGTSQYLANFSCGFDLLYYANNGTNWACNVTVVDNFTFSGNVSGNDSLANTTTINALLALNVTPLINYGNLSVGDTSTAQEANITNIGNNNINISVRAFGGNDESNVSAQNISFICDQGNITHENQKYGLNSSGDFTADFTAVNYTFQQISNLTVLQQTNDSQQVTNSSYWRLYVPPGPFGICNGTVVFQAETA